MLLQELMYLIVVAKLRSTLLEMPNLVETCILNLRRKTLLYSTARNVGYKKPGASRLQMSCFKELDISCIQLLDNV